MTHFCDISEITMSMKWVTWCYTNPGTRRGRSRYDRFLVKFIKTFPRHVFLHSTDDFRSKLERGSVEVIILAHALLLPVKGTILLKLTCVRRKWALSRLPRCPIPPDTLWRVPLLAETNLGKSSMYDLNEVFSKRYLRLSYHADL